MIRVSGRSYEVSDFSGDPEGFLRAVRSHSSATPIRYFSGVTPEMFGALPSPMPHVGEGEAVVLAASSGEISAMRVPGAEGLVRLQWRPVAGRSAGRNVFADPIPLGEAGDDPGVAPSTAEAVAYIGEEEDRLRDAADLSRVELVVGKGGQALAPGEFAPDGGRDRSTPSGHGLDDERLAALRISADGGVIGVRALLSADGTARVPAPPVRVAAMIGDPRPDGRRLALDVVSAGDSGEWIVAGVAGRFLRDRALSRVGVDVLRVVVGRVAVPRATATVTVGDLGHLTDEEVLDIHQAVLGWYTGTLEPADYGAEVPDTCGASVLAWDLVRRGLVTETAVPCTVDLRDGTTVLSDGTTATLPSATVGRIVDALFEPRE